MAEFTKELSQEYWRPAQSNAGRMPASGFQTADEAFCNVCGTPYAAGARFCHLCGLGREDDLRLEKSNVIMEWIDLNALCVRFGLSRTSLAFVLIAAIFVIATVMTGMVYNTSTVAEWQAVQIWRIEWLLSTVVALLAAMLFRTRA